MAKLEPYINPMTYRVETFLMLLMGVLPPRPQPAPRPLPDDYDEPAHNPPFSNMHRPPYGMPPPVSRDGREAYPYPRNRFYGAGEVKGMRERGRLRTKASIGQLRDVWTCMRAVSRVLYEHVKRHDGREKRVTFNREVQWYIFGGDEDSYDGDSEDGDSEDGVRRH
ncbi:hypothetical protein BU23DRAFT_568652 [Bimuria novae-zelandiae CBS 107.79]|uniref:Uncharacterized protein n=1 Tax=Bimuria novae-zelandiae CBS 107.79 TaxID=1447943 RepID=A0A6A5V6V4_9PLEO|nr:hypothetical protein BU23DRAFT_568652 [Bimuria novae-zelandiae CBS 107.79]